MRKFLVIIVILMSFFSFIPLNLNSQTFTEQTAVTLPGISLGSAVWGDYDNDGDADILIAGFDGSNLLTVKVFKNNGSNSFTDLGSVFTPAFPSISNYHIRSTAQWVDFDNDGYLDILYNGQSASFGNTFLIYKNEGNGTFTLKTTFDYLNRDNGTIEVGDYNNDGDPDILTTGNTATRIFQNQGLFTFYEQTAVSIPGYPTGVAKWFDFDNDEDLDIVIAGSSYSNITTEIYQNQGNNNFVKLPISIPQGTTGNGWIDISDFNSDGFLDLAITGDYGTGIIKNNGNNTFSRLTGIPIPSASDSKIAWGDLDNDGDPDILISGSNNGTNITKIYINNGNNTFSELAGTSFAAVKDNSIDLFDYDGDGDLDVLISGNTGPSKITKVYRNDSPVVNAVPLAPTGISTTAIQGGNIILSWDPVTTDNTNIKSLSYNVSVGTTSGGINIVAPNSSTTTGFRKISGMGNGQLDTMYVLKNLKRQTYYWRVQAVDNSFKGGSFSSQSSFTYSYSYQAFCVKASPIGGKEATLSWARGNSTSCIVFMKVGKSGIGIPVNGSTYTASSVFKSGTQILSTGWYCVYKGTLSSVNVTGLKANTDYIFQVLEFDGTGGSEAYNTLITADNSLTFKTGYFTEVKGANLTTVNRQSPVYEQYSSVAWLDFDNDNDLDFIETGLASSKFYRNDGNDLFTLLYTWSSGYSVAAGDYNNDGYVDFFISANPSRLYRNNGGVNFTELTATGITATNSGSVNMGDYDNDGDLDIAISGDAGVDGRVTKIFRNNGDGTFTEQSSISLMGVNGINCTSKFADYNNDGYPDLLVSGMNNSGNLVTKIYKNTGANEFIEQTGISFPTNYSSAFDWGDYDSDGDLDLVETRDENKSIVYKNNGNNTFTEASSISLSTSKHGSVKWGDYDGDGDLDILLSGYDINYVPFTKIYKNNGNDSFTEDLTCKIAGVVWGSSNWVDYDNDGDLDVVIAGNGSDLAMTKIFRNDLGVINAKPAAPTNATATVDRSQATLKWNSVRNDNTPYKSMSYNIKVGTSAGAINITSPHSSTAGLRSIVAPGNCGTDTTFTFSKLPFGNYSWSVQAVDNGFTGGFFSTEGSFSIVPVQAKNLSAKIISTSSLLLKWDRGNGDRCVVFCKQASSGSAVPVNNTGYIADAGYGFGGQIGSSGWYCVYNGRADSVAVTGLVNSKEYSFHIFEYTGTYGAEQYFPQVSDGNPGVFSTSLFVEQTGIVIPDSYRNGMVLGDYNKDGLIDILVPGNPTKLYKNMGNNTFADQSIATLPIAYDGSAAFGDYDNDGDLDIIISGSTLSYTVSNPFTKIYRNDGTNVFTEQTSISLTGVCYSSVEWGDYNNDGFLDIILTGATGEDPSFNPITKIYKNNGGTSFSEQTQISLPKVFRGSASFGDFNNDGLADVLITGALDYDYYDNTISKMFKNNGDNTFTEQTQIVLPGFSFSQTTWSDFDNDGDLDFGMTEMGEMLIYENKGDGIFTNKMLLSLGYMGSCSMGWADYDNDGYLDFLLTNPGLDSKLYHNTHGIPSPASWFNQQDDGAISSKGYNRIYWFDYDNDGDADILFAKDGVAAKVFKNNLIMKSGLFKANAAPSAPTDLSFLNSPKGVILKWNPVTTDETPSPAMTYNVKIGTTKSNFNIVSPQSDAAGLRRIAVMGNAQTDTTYIIKNLPATKYYWSVQAVDQAFKGGAWSAVDSFNVKNILSYFTADTVCLGVATTFTNQSAAFGDVIQSYLWDFGDGTTSVLQNPTHIFGNSGTQNVKLITYSLTTSDTLVKQVIIKAKPAVNFTATTACQGAETLITNTTNTAVLNITSWSWDYGDGKGSVAQSPVSHGYLSAGDYQVTLTASADNNCSGTVIKTVSVAAFPIASIATNSPLQFCSGDSVALTVTANPGYTYNWLLNGTNLIGGNTNTFKARVTGSYSVEVINTKGNCKTTSNAASVVTFNAPVRPLIDKGLYSEGMCLGETPLKLKAVAITPGYTYHWFRNGASFSNSSTSVIEGFLQAGIYKLQADLGGCKSTMDSVNLLFADALPKPDIYAKGPTVWYLICNNETASSYKWYFNGTLIQGADKYQYVANQKLGKYNVSIANSKGCYTLSDTITIPKGITGIDDADAFSDLVIYPNPTTGLINIRLNNQIFANVTISVLDQSGKEIINIKTEKSSYLFEKQIDMRNQPGGIYIIKTVIANQTDIRKVIVK
jgi:PKD repeat protein